MRRRFIQNKKESLWTPFYIEALEDGVSFSIGDEVEYKINEGDWISLGKNVNSESINKGSRLYIKGQIVNSTLYENTFSIQGLCKIGGDIKSLSFGEQAKKINKINDSQFQFLFENCTTIKEVLIDFHLITTLDKHCFHGMFSGCTSLVKVHNLPAVTLKERCYMSMFAGCTNLNYIKMLATDISASNCLSYWVNGVSFTGIFVKSKDATWDVRGVNGIPEGWTVITDDYPTNSVGMPDSKEFGFPLFLNTEYLGESDYVIMRYRDIKDIIEPLVSWFSQNRDGYGEVPYAVLYQDRIFIDGYIVTRMYYDQSLDSLMVETQKDYGNDSMIGFSSDGNLYVQIVKQQIGGGVEISFNIDGRDYTAAKGMTWDQWVKSSYYEPSYGGFQIYVVENTVYVYSDTGDWFLIGQKGDDRIIEDTRYELYGPVPAPEL